MAIYALQNFFRGIRSKCGTLKMTKLLVFANKNDLKGAMSASEISEAMGLNSIKEHAWHIQSCCALTGEGYTPKVLYLI